MSDHKDRTVNARMRRYRARLALVRAVRRALERGVDVRATVGGILGDLGVTQIGVTGHLK